MTRKFSNQTFNETTVEDYLIRYQKQNAYQFNPDLNVYEYNEDIFEIGSIFRDIEKFTNDVVNTKSLPFEVQIKNGKTIYKENNKLARYYDNFNHMIGAVENDLNKYFGAQLLAFREAYLMLEKEVAKGDVIYFGNGKWSKQAFNLVVTCLKKVLKGSAYKKCKRDARRKSKRQYNALVDYIQAHLSKHSKILVVCAGLHLRKQHYNRVTEEEMCGMREQLFNKLRRDVRFENMLGYICKLEENLEGGLHLHVMLLMDGNKHKNASYFANLLSDLWEDDISFGRGYGHDCHRDDNPFKWLNVAMVSYDDLDSIKKFFKAATYMTKIEQSLRCRTKLKRNAITMGHSPDVKHSLKTGRPRNYKYLNWDFTEVALNAFKEFRRQ